MAIKKRASRKIFWGAASGVLSLAFATIGFALPEPFPDLFHAPRPTYPVGATQSLDSRDPVGLTVNLGPGTYKVHVSGTYTYSGPASGPFFADAECSVMYQFGQAVWVPNQYPGEDPGGDALDVLVNNQRVEWTPSVNAASGTPAAGQTSSAPGCDSRPSTPHKYFRSFDWAGGNINFKINEKPQGYGDNNGILEVSFTTTERPKEELVAVLAVPAANPEGIYTPPLLVGQTYRLEASGTYEYATIRNYVADVECSITPTRLQYWFKYDPNAPEGQDILDLHLNDGVPNGYADGNVSWVPLQGGNGPGTCSTDTAKTYSYTYVAKDPLGMVGREFTRLNIRVFDGNHFDNKGVITVKVFQQMSVPSLTTDPNELPGKLDELPIARPPLPNPPALPVPADPCATTTCNVISVFANQSGGTSTSSLPPGTYVAEVSGTYAYESGLRADAECTTGAVATVIQGDPTWQRNRYPYQAGLGKDLFDLLVAGKEVDWKAKGAPAAVSCDDAQNAKHEYQVEFEWVGDGNGGPAPINFKIFDTEFTRNSADRLTVKIYSPVNSSNEILVGAYALNSADPSGLVTSPVLAGQKYRLEISGKYIYYRYDGPGFEADAECSSKNSDYVFAAGTSPKANDAGWIPDRFVTSSLPGDPQDVYVDDLTEGNGILDGVQTWRPKTSAGPCATDDQHTYYLTFTATDSTPLNIKAFERETYWYSDNVGILTVSLFMVP